MTTAAFDDVKAAARDPQEPRPAPQRGDRIAVLLAVIPFALTLVFAALLASRRTRPFAVLMCQENHPVELLTFALLIAAGVQGWRLARQLKRQGAATIWRAFYAVFATLLFLVAGEEISWGQWFFHFQTPAALSEINTQHEFNLHNIKGMGGHTEYLRLTFGLGGLIGLALWRAAAFRLVAVPPVLWAWFAVITALSAADLYCDYHALDTNIAKALDVLSEVVELMIAMSASLYLFLNARRLRQPST
jgi:hypothetical protein